MKARGAIGLLLIASAACTTTQSDKASDGISLPPRSPSPVAAPRFDPHRVIDFVQRMAAEVGPRQATSAAYGRAAIMVEEQFRSLGYRVRRQAFSVPAGESGGRAVPAGDTFNLLAELAAFDAERPHLLIGAHLDTVPQSPGSVDNATGVGIMLEVARLIAEELPSVPVAFVAFGAEEARSPHGGLFGSRYFVTQLDRERRRAMVGAIVIDRVGTGLSVPVCTGGTGSRSLAGQLLAAAVRIHVAATSCTNRSSDHWSFERAGLTAARVGPDEYPEYHTSGDAPSVVVAAQVERAGKLIWEAIKAMAPPEAAPSP